MSVTVELTDAEYEALERHRKLTPALRGAKIAKDAQYAAILVESPCGCGFLVRQKGDPKTGHGHEMHWVRTSRLIPDALTCDCQANLYGSQCSHIYAVRSKYPDFATHSSHSPSSSKEAS